MWRIPAGDGFGGLNSLVLDDLAEWPKREDAEVHDRIEGMFWHKLGEQMIHGETTIVNTSPTYSIFQ